MGGVAGARWLAPAIWLAGSLLVHLGHAPLAAELQLGMDLETVRLVSGAAAYFSAAWLGSRLAGLALEHHRTGRRRAPRLMRELIAVVLFLVAAISTAVLVFGQPTSSVLAGSGILIALLGFAIRNVVADVLSASRSALRRPVASATGSSSIRRRGGGWWRSAGAPRGC